MSLLPWKVRLDFIVDIAIGVFLGGLLLKAIWWLVLDWVVP